MKKEFLDQLIQFITAAFGLAAGLAWNSAIQDTITLYLPQDMGSLLGKFLYAIILTIIAVIITKNLADLKERSDKKVQKER